MTSSVHHYSVHTKKVCADHNDQTVGQKKQSDHRIQIAAAGTGISLHDATNNANVQFPAPSHLGVGHAQAAYPYPDPYYRSIFVSQEAQPYSHQSMVHMHLMGIKQAGLPLPSEADAVEEPVFVNAKQYHGILRRRQSRAKAESEYRVARSRKPYLHESRHLHALRRARGCGGRFLNATKNENDKQKESTSASNLQENMNFTNTRKGNALSP